LARASSVAAKEDVFSSASAWWKCQKYVFIFTTNQDVGKKLERNVIKRWK